MTATADSTAPACPAAPRPVADTRLAAAGRPADAARRPAAGRTDASRPTRRLLRDLERPADALAHIGPNWFSCVMGTGIVANAAALLPVQVPGLRAVAVAVWLLAAALFVVLVVATVAHWVLHPENARAHADNAAMVPFYGAPPMAAMTVGAGALLVGRDVLGATLALDVAAALWTLGTVAGVACCVVVPYRALTRRRGERHPVSVTWLMAVVPPMVSAATGAALVPHVAAGQPREALLLACYALFGLGLAASLLAMAVVAVQLASSGLGPASGMPTLFIVLGPLGQSVTAANLLGAQAHLAVDAPLASALRAAGPLYGVPVWGFAMTWLVLAAALVLRTARAGLPFSLGWWSFTFPVGTVVTGTSALSVSTGLTALEWAAVGLYGLLVVAWLTAATRTAHGALRTGALLRPA